MYVEVQPFPGIVFTSMNMVEQRLEIAFGLTGFMADPSVISKQFRVLDSPAREIGTIDRGIVSCAYRTEVSVCLRQSKEAEGTACTIKPLVLGLYGVRVWWWSRLHI